METAIRLQENRAKVSHIRTCKPANNISNITIKLRAVKKQISKRRRRAKLIKKLKARVTNNPLELCTRVRLCETVDQEAKRPEKHNDIKTLDDLNQLAGTLFPQTPDERLKRVPIDILSQHEPTWINEQELRVAKYMIRNKKYTGPDGLRFSILNRILELEPEIIRDIARISYAANHIPDHCKTTQGTLIPKKVPGKFRVVHVASPLTAYLELIALNRLETALETKRLKDPNQFGFCRGKGRHDLLAVLIAEIAKHRVLVRAGYSDKATAAHNMSTIIGLDVKGAFDNVCQASIIKKLYEQLNDNPIRHWMRAFMMNHSIRVKLGNLKSDGLGIRRGVPQGSALGPILWNYAIADLRNRVRTEGLDVSIMAYADDLTILCNGSKNHPFLQRALNRINRYLKENGPEVSGEKSELMHVLGPGRRPRP